LFTNRIRLNERHVPYPINCEICNESVEKFKKKGNESVESDWHFIFQCDTSFSELANSRIMASNSGQRANNEFSSRSGARYLFARSRGCGEPVYGDCVGDCGMTGMNGHGIKKKGIRTRLLNGQQMLPKVLLLRGDGLNQIREN
jgi:hypothetical protein